MTIRSLVPIVQCKWTSVTQVSKDLFMRAGQVSTRVAPVAIPLTPEAWRVETCSLTLMVQCKWTSVTQHSRGISVRGKQVLSELTPVAIPLTPEAWRVATCSLTLVL